MQHQINEIGNIVTQTKTEKQQDVTIEMEGQKDGGWNEVWPWASEVKNEQVGSITEAREFSIRLDADFHDFDMPLFDQ